jgi:hypothetical protein
MAAASIADPIRCDAMQKMLPSGVQPVMVAAILLFWAFGPADWINTPWSIVITTLTTTALIQTLEWVNDRHSSRAPDQAVPVSARQRIDPITARRPNPDAAVAA